MESKKTKITFQEFKDLIMSNNIKDIIYKQWQCEALVIVLKDETTLFLESSELHWGSSLTYKKYQK